MTMGAFIEQPEVIGGHLEAVWRPKKPKERQTHNMGLFAACLSCLSKAACPKLLGGRLEAVWRPFGDQRSINRGRKHNRGLLAACLSCLSKAA